MEGTFGVWGEGTLRSRAPHRAGFGSVSGIFPRDVPSTGSKVAKGQSIATDKALVTRLLPHTRSAAPPQPASLSVSCLSPGTFSVQGWSALPLASVSPECLDLRVPVC